MGPLKQVSLALLWLRSGGKVRVGSSYLPVFPTWGSTELSMRTTGPESVLPRARRDDCGLEYLEDNQDPC